MLSVALALPGLHGSHSESSGVPGVGRIREDTCRGEQRLHGVILGKAVGALVHVGISAAGCLFAFLPIFIFLQSIFSSDNSH